LLVYRRERERMNKVVASAVFSAMLLASTTIARAGTPDGCQPDETPMLRNGFHDVGDLLGSATVGVPVDCEHPNPQGAPDDIMQTTSDGTFYYYKFNNLVVFTDQQLHHWATAHDGIVTWTGYQPYPPEVGSVLHPWDSLTPGEAPPPAG
jgi:hypothetical protein